MSKRVYLCGPISGLSYGKATSWRGHFALRLADDIVPVSPMRGKRYLEGHDNIGFSYADPSVSKDKIGSLLSSSPGISTRDRFDVQNCDLVVANFLGADKISIGSVIELGWADAFRKPIIMVAEESNIMRNHPMSKHICAFQTDDLEIAIEVTNIILSDSFAREHQ